MRRIVGFLMAVVVGCALTGAALAQQDEITVDSKPTDAEIRGWLMREDAQLVAWGAYFARERTDDGAVTLLLRQVDRWQPDGATQDRHDAMSAVLDALIERREVVSPERIGVLAGDFPVQAVILASRLPIAEATPLLLGWYGDGEARGDSVLPRMAAMMLAKSPPPGFAGSVLAHSEEELSIAVRDDSEGLGNGGASGCCGDSLGQLPVKGWPPLFWYGLDENGLVSGPASEHSQSGNVLVIEAGGDRITYRRGRTDQGSGSCNFPHGLDAGTRQHLIAEMLGISVEAMPWRVKESELIRWRSDGQYRSRLEAVVRSHEAQLEGTVAVLVAKGFVTADERIEVRPKLSILIFDERTTHCSTLPGVVLRDQRTAVMAGDVPACGKADSLRE
jgi:hypothetical protein